jgi:FAD/FMN-containing dehydrogenase
MARRTLSLDTLRVGVRGAVIAPDDDGFDAARSVYNAMIDRHPAVIVRARDAADVIAAIRFAREHELALAVRGGGHSVPGYGTIDHGLVLDLGELRSVRVDPAARRAWVGGGAVLGDFDHATHAFGLATPAGFNSTTGVGGLTLGGGIGAYLSRKLGLTCDNLVSADLVTADGRFVTASARENPDLFWALRGGGGNFGVVTTFELALHPVRNIVGGPMFFDIASAADVMRAWRDVIATAPRELSGFFGFHIAPPLPFIPEARHGKPHAAIVACWSGPPKEAEKAFAPLRKSGKLVAEHVGEIPYPALQSAFDALLPRGLQQYWKADFVGELTDAAIAEHVKHGPKVPFLSSTMHLYPINGAVHDVAPDATAFACRDAQFACVIAGLWPDPADNEANTKWVRDYYAAIHPHSGYAGGYTNFMAADDQQRVRDNYGASYDRLAKLKKTWDPDNVFRLNQNVKPA